MDRVLRCGRGVWATGGALIATVALAGCAEVRTTSHDLYEASHLRTLGVDPSSPVAADAERAEKTEGPVPSFADVPPKPTDVRSVAAYKKEVVEVVADKRTLAGWERANPPGASDAEGYAETQRGRLAGQTPVSEARQAESEAYAKRLRAEVEAPPRKPRVKAADKAAKPKTAPTAY